MKLVKFVLIVFAVVFLMGMATKEKCCCKSCSKNSCEKKCDYEYLWKPDGHKGLVSIFNGKDLSGWMMTGGKLWVVEEGGLLSVSELTKKDRAGGYIWTEKKYKDFILELDFKVAKGSNSGVFIRTTDINDVVQSGLEIQILDSYGKKDGQLTRHDCGALYDCQAPFKNMVKKAGQWNHMVIVCQQQKVYAALNGVCVVSADLNLWQKPGMNPDGSKNKFTDIIAKHQRAGHIGFQDYGCKVWYRNIKIRDLNE